MTYFIQEAEDGNIDLPDDEPDVIRLMIQYLYEGNYAEIILSTNLSEDDTIDDESTDESNYSDSEGSSADDGASIQVEEPIFPHSCNCSDKDGHYCYEQLCKHHKCGDIRLDCCSEFTCKACVAEQLVIHPKMYEVADKYDVAGLKDLVAHKFKASCKAYWDKPAFAQAAHYAFSTTPENDMGLRSIVAKVICENIDALINKPEIEVLLTEFGGLSYQLLKMKTEKYWKPPVKLSQTLISNGFGDWAH